MGERRAVNFDFSHAPINEDIFSILQTLPPSSLDRLYGGDGAGEAEVTAAPFTCRAVLQSLLPIAKQYVMRLICISGSIPRVLLKGWVEDIYIDVSDAALLQLFSLRVIVTGAGEHSGSDSVQLNSPFRKNLLKALLTPDAAPWKDDIRYAMKPDKRVPTRAKIEGEMHRKWESVLYFLVGSEGELSSPIPSVVNFMEQAGLMASKGSSNSLVITDRGYEFMLRDIHVQAWMFVLALINSEGTDENTRNDLLSFLFMLSYCTVGEDYPLSALTSHQTRLAEDFIDLGLLHKRKASSTRFYTTEVAVNLIFGARATEHPSRSLIQMSHQSEAVESQNIVQLSPRMTLIVETNYQVVAYTSSNLHLAMLSLFMDLKTRLPNMVVGTITRESIRKALVTGIKAKQIIDFLMWHAHPSILDRNPIVPENIADQIILWEQERTRVAYKKGVLIEIPFQNIVDFDAIENYAVDLGGCMWSSRAKRIIIVTSYILDKVTSRINSMKV